MIKVVFSHGEFDSPPVNNGLIYHYCSTEAFFNIIKTGKIRLGDLKSMNDPSELSLQEINIGKMIYDEYSKNPFPFQIENNGVALKMANFLMPYEMDYKITRAGKYTNLFFALCFSTKENDLMQWRLYSDNGKGVCLGFNRKTIQKYISQDPNFSLITVKYKSIKEVVENIAKDSLMEIKKLYESHEIEKLKEYRLNLSKKLIKEWPKYKVCDYKSENEQRLVYKLHNNQVFSNVNSADLKVEDFLDVDIKVKDGELQLFKEIPIKELGLTSITLGPLNNTSKDCLNILLGKYNITIPSASIYKSFIPYRK